MKGWQKWVGKHCYADVRKKLDEVFGDGSFPNFSTQEYSKWKSPQTYGHQPCAEIKPYVTKPDRRVKIHRLAYRCSEAKFGALQSVLREDGFLTWQAFLEEAVRVYLERRATT